MMSQCMGVHAFGSVVATIKTPKNHKHVSSRKKNAVLEFIGWYQDWYDTSCNVAIHFTASLVPPSQPVGRASVRSAVWWRLCAEHGILLTTYRRYTAMIWITQISLSSVPYAYQVVHIVYTLDCWTAAGGGACSSVDPATSWKKREAHRSGAPGMQK